MQQNYLTSEEFISVKLREIYAEYGYSFYRMKRFEEYDFYAGRKDFLTSQAILTFTDFNGRLMALRPDVTLSIIKHASSGKYFYHENVYRVPKNSSSFREIPQCGIECTGDYDLNEILTLAVLSLKACCSGRRFVLDTADAGLVSRLMPRENRDELLRNLSGKNLHGLAELNAPSELIALSRRNPECEFDGVPEDLMRYIRTDYSAVTTLSYYNGIVFKGYIEGIPEAVLSGGEYRIEGVKGAGFAVYLDKAGVKKNA